MNQDDPLRRALDGLRAADESRRASPHVKAGVFAAFDEWAARSSSGLVVTAVRAAAPFAVAALMVLIAVSHLVISTRENRRLAVSTRSVEPPAPAAQLPQPHVETRVSDVTAGAPIETAARQGAGRFSQGSMIARGGNVETVYARIPRRYLPLLGIPMIEPDAEGAVGIEVDIGEDGQYKAIRIVQ
jgi:hypothetical protein